MRSYGALEHPGSTGHRGSSSILKSRIFVLVGFSAVFLIVVVQNATFESQQNMLEEINNLELNAYLSASQVEEFNKLMSEQKMITAGTAGLLELEQNMKPEDTKVVFFCCG